MDWDDLRIFLAVARTESLSGAGRRLGMDASTIGRRIARLEAAVDAGLVHDEISAGDWLLNQLELVQARAELPVAAAAHAATGASCRAAPRSRWS